MCLCVVIIRVWAGHNAGGWVGGQVRGGIQLDGPGDESHLLVMTHDNDSHRCAMAMTYTCVPWQ